MWQSREGAVAWTMQRRLCPCFIDPRRTQVAETSEKELQAETLNKEMQLDNQPVTPNRRSSRVPAIVVSSLALVVIGAAATLYVLPNFPIALPNLNGLAELFPRETASAPIPEPAVNATLRDIQSAQRQNADTLQQNTGMLQQNTGMLRQGAANLEFFRQGFTAQQTDLRRISNQLSSLITRVDSLQNAVAPLTTSSITQPNARARLVGTPRKKTSRLPKPFGPVSVGGAPLSPLPAPGSGAGDVTRS
jgi:hypothetical protein